MSEADAKIKNLQYLEECLARFEEIYLRIESRIQILEQDIYSQKNDYRLDAEGIQASLKDILLLVSKSTQAATTPSVELAKEHIRTLETVTQKQIEKVRINNEEFQDIIKKSLDRLDKVSSYTINSMSDAISSFRISDFQRITELSCHTMEDTATATMQTLKNTVRWYHWKNLILAATIAIFSTLTVTLFLNDETPWEQHKHVAVERQYGSALLNAWPHLSDEEKQKIIQNSENVLQSS